MLMLIVQYAFFYQLSSSNDVAVVKNDNINLRQKTKDGGGLWEGIENTANLWSKGFQKGINEQGVNDPTTYLPNTTLMAPMMDRTSSKNKTRRIINATKIIFQSFINITKKLLGLPGLLKN